MNSPNLCRLIVVKIAASTAVIIGLSISSASATSTEAKAMAVKGDVKSGPPAAPALPQVQQGSNIRVGHAIKTAEVSELLMSPFQGSAVRVLEKSSVILQEADLQKSGEKVIGRKAVLELKKGTGQVIVDPRGPKADFKISTPQCVAAARGTVYQTAVVDKETTVTIVLRGEVVVTCEDSKGRHETVVKAGMKLTTRKKRGEGGKELLGPNEPGPGDCVSILEPATKAELAGLADLENIFGGPTTAAFPFPTDIQIPIEELLNPKDISGGPIVVSPEQP